MAAAPDGSDFMMRKGVAGVCSPGTLFVFWLPLKSDEFPGNVRSVWKLCFTPCRAEIAPEYTGSGVMMELIVKLIEVPRRVSIVLHLGNFSRLKSKRGLWPRFSSSPLGLNGASFLRVWKSHSLGGTTTLA